MNEKEYCVTIPLEKYEELLNESFYYNTILGYLDLAYKDADTYSSGEKIKFDNDYINVFLRIIDRNYYEKQLKKMNEKKGMMTY